jgi:hypothetical protein
MTLRIERAERRGSTIFVLSGRLETEHIAELKELLELQTEPESVVVNLEEVRMADREAVRFLARCEAAGVRLEGCPAYIREWMQKEGTE